MKLFNTVIFLLLLVMPALALHGSGRRCLTPNRERGRCVPSKRCQFVLDLQRIYRNKLPPIIQNQLKQMTCYGEPETTFHLCCPIKSLISSKMDTTIKKSAKIEQSNAPNLSYIDPRGFKMLSSITDCGPYSEARAVSHGIPATDGELSWLVALKYETSGRPFLCGGTLITDRFVLTAAHCTTSSSKLIGVLIGEINLDYVAICIDTYGPTKCKSINKEYDIEDIRPHPLYKKNGISYDIALIKLVQTVKLEYPIKPICLPLTEAYQCIPNDEILYVGGWGKTLDDAASSLLLQANVKRQDLDVCRNYFLDAQLTDNHICALGDYFQHTCQGDSGGPLFFITKSKAHAYIYVQLGVISTGGIHCGVNANQPGIFASVVDMLPWITQNLY